MEELFKCVFAKHWVYISPEIDSTLQDTYQKYRAAFALAKKSVPDVFSADAEIELDPACIDFVDRQLGAVNFEQNRADLFSEIYEVFGGTGVKSSEGQFFTPTVAVDFLIELVAPKIGKIACDPACGAGSFLSHLAVYWKTQGATSDQILNGIFGYEKDSYLTRLARARLALIVNKSPRIICGDSLSKISLDGKSFEFPECDYVLTNPPFGSKILAADSDTLTKFKLARTWIRQGNEEFVANGKIQANVPPQILFLELCLSILKPGGLLGAILPESLVSSKSYAHVVHYLRTEAEIQAVVGMPEALFKTSGKGGTHTKTIALIAQKKPAPKEIKAVFFAEARWCGHDSRAKKIPKNDIPAIAANFSAFKTGGFHSSGHLGVSVPKERVGLNLAPRAYEFDIDSEVERISLNHDVFKFGDLVEKGVLSVRTGDEVGKLAYGTGNIPFIRTSDIATWEIKLDPKHRISEEIYDIYKDKQDVQERDIFMVRDGTYLIGTCAIVQKSDLPLVYQSHIYKIRVLKADVVNPYLLLASLSCAFVQRQIKSFCVSQDIIDSLGDKLHELMLPFPKDHKKCSSIAKRVQEALRARAKSKELAKKAMQEVVAD
jgi:type I restriction enzyme M protein